MVANPLPVAWRVRAVDDRGVIQHERAFHISSYRDAEDTAERFPACRVSVEGLTFEDQLK
jgi:hypothetical protein